VRWAPLVLLLVLPACGHAAQPLIRGAATPTRANDSAPVQPAPGSSAAAPPQAKPVTPASQLATVTPAENAAITAQIAGMSLQEKVGQLFMVSFYGTGDNTRVRSLIARDHIGNLVLVGSDAQSPAELAALVTDLQGLTQESDAGILAIVGVDQEGGDVQSLQQGFTLFPNPMALGATGSTQLAQQEGKAMGEEMRAAGINLDLAPVLDVNTNPANPVIGLRSLGDRPALVSQLGTAYIAGLHAAGVLAVAKHFPGHGATAQDSHLVLPIDTSSRSFIDANDLPPFATALHSGVDAVLVAHVSYPALDASGLPASLSNAIVTGLLRGRLGWDGVVLSDDLGMKAVSAGRTPGELAVAAVEAGDDLLIFTTSEPEIDQAASALDAAVLDGRIPEQRLDDSVRRILELKSRLLPSGGTFDATTHADVARAVSEQAVTVIAGAGLPLSSQLSGGKPLLVVSPSTLADASGTELGAAIRQRYPDSREVLVDPLSGAGQAVALAAAPSAAAVIVATLPSNAGQDQFVRALLAANPHTVVLLLGLPYQLASFPAAPSVLATYGALPAQLDAAAAVLFGEIPARGTLPVTIPGKLDSSQTSSP
jgi:beta-N-acetylhexosaminidase